MNKLENYHKIRKAKNEIMQEIKESKTEITRELLLKCFHNHQLLYANGRLTKANKYILDQAIKEIWESTFDVVLGDLIYG